MDEIVKVSDNVFGRILNEYSNGFETTAGFVKTKEVSDCLSVTYDQDHWDCLPVGWPRMRWLDDNNKRQFIKQVMFDAKDYPYVMADGTRSRTVTE
jgi:hypothetical protein